MSDPIFVPHLTLDGAVTIVTILLGTGAWYVGKIRREDKIASTLEALASSLSSLASRQSSVEAEMREFGKAIVQIARQDERITAIIQRQNLTDQLVNELRHGEGYVLPLVPTPKRSGS